MPRGLCRQPPKRATRDARNWSSWAANRVLVCHSPALVEPDELSKRLGPAAMKFPRLLRCEQCAKTSDENARGWRAYRSDLTAEAEDEDTSAGDVPAVV